AGVTQIQRMRVALAAIADDGDLLALDQVQVGVAVVVNAHGLSTPTPWPPMAVSFCDGASRFIERRGQARALVALRLPSRNSREQHRTQEERPPGREPSIGPPRERAR